MAGLERPDRRLRFELKALALVASGAVPGALVRWQLVERLGPQIGGASAANLLANLAGCLLLGFLSGPMPYRTPLMLLLGIGFCGSLSTFSGWILDLASLQHRGQGLGGWPWCLPASLWDCWRPWEVGLLAAACLAAASPRSSPVPPWC